MENYDESRLKAPSGQEAHAKMETDVLQTEIKAADQELHTKMEADQNQAEDDTAEADDVMTKLLESIDAQMATVAEADHKTILHEELMAQGPDTESGDHQDEQHNGIEPTGEEDYKEEWQIPDPEEEAREADVPDFGNMTPQDVHRWIDERTKEEAEQDEDEDMEQGVTGPAVDPSQVALDQFVKKSDSDEKLDENMKEEAVNTEDPSVKPKEQDGKEDLKVDESSDGEVDKSSDDSSDSDSDLSSDSDDGRAVSYAGSDDEGDLNRTQGAPRMFRTRNEQIDKIQQPPAGLTKVEPSELALLGTVSNIVSGTFIIFPNDRSTGAILARGVPLCDKDGKVVGAVQDVIGTTSKPRHTMRSDKLDELAAAGFAKGSDVFYPETKKVEEDLQELKKAVFFDASNVFDEEAPPEDSDDEDERERRQERRANGRAGGRGRGDGFRGDFRGRGRGGGGRVYAQPHSRRGRDDFQRGGYRGRGYDQPYRGGYQSRDDPRNFVPNMYDDQEPCAFGGDNRDRDPYRDGNRPGSRGNPGYNGSNGYGACGNQRPMKYEDQDQRRPSYPQNAPAPQYPGSAAAYTSPPYNAGVAQNATPYNFGGYNSYNAAAQAGPAQYQQPQQSYQQQRPAYQQPHQAYQQPALAAQPAQPQQQTPNMAAYTAWWYAQQAQAQQQGRQQQAPAQPQQHFHQQQPQQQYQHQQQQYQPQPAAQQGYQQPLPSLPAGLPPRPDVAMPPIPPPPSQYPDT